jgi:hypothetical protein
MASPATGVFRDRELDALATARHHRAPVLVHFQQQVVDALPQLAVLCPQRVCLAACLQCIRQRNPSEV